MPASSSERTLALLTAIYLGGIVTANAMAAKLLVIAGVHLTSGALAIPLVYITTDLINELFGPKATRKVVYMGLVANFILVLLTQIGMRVPASPFGASQDHYEAIFAMTPRIVVASVVAYLCSSLLDIHIFAWLRALTHGKHFWLRKNGSTAVSQMVDTVMFVGVAFGGVLPLRTLAVMALGQYLVKMAAAPLGTPLSYLALRVAR